MSTHRNGNGKIAFFTNETGNTFALTAENDRDRALEIRIFIMYAIRLCGKGPNAHFLQLVDGRSDIGNLGNRHVRSRAGGGFEYGLSDDGTMSLGNDHAMRARAVCATNDRAEVMRIFHAIANDDEGCFALFSRRKNDLLHRLVFNRGSDSRNALMRVAERDLIESLFIDFRDDDTALLCFRKDLRDRAFSFALLDV